MATYDYIINDTWYEGQSDPKAAGDTVTWNGNTYTFQTAAVSTPTSNLAFGSFDAARIQVMATGGTLHVVNLNKTWKWAQAPVGVSGGTWQGKSVTVVYDEEYNPGSVETPAEGFIKGVWTNDGTTVSLQKSTSNNQNSRTSDEWVTQVFKSGTYTGVNNGAWQNNFQWINLALVIEGGYFSGAINVSGNQGGVIERDMALTMTGGTVNGAVYVGIYSNGEGATGVKAFHWTRQMGSSTFTISGGTVNGAVYGITGSGAGGIVGVKGETEEREMLVINVSSNAVLKSMIYMQQGGTIYGKKVLNVTDGAALTKSVIMQSGGTAFGDVKINVDKSRVNSLVVTTSASAVINGNVEVNITGSTMTSYFRLRNGANQGVYNGSATVTVKDSIIYNNLTGCGEQGAANRIGDLHLTGSTVYVSGNIKTFDTITVDLGTAVTAGVTFTDYNTLYVNTDTAKTDGTTAYKLVSAASSLTATNVTVTGKYADEFTTRVYNASLYAFNGIYLNSNWAGTATGTAVNFTFNGQTHTAIYGINAFWAWADAYNTLGEYGGKAYVVGGTIAAQSVTTKPYASSRAMELVLGDGTTGIVAPSGLVLLKGDTVTTPKDYVIRLNDNVTVNGNLTAIAGSNATRYGDTCIYVNGGTVTGNLFAGAIQGSTVYGKSVVEMNSGYVGSIRLIGVNDSGNVQTGGGTFTMTGGTIQNFIGVNGLDDGNNVVGVSGITDNEDILVANISGGTLSGAMLSKCGTVYGNAVLNVSGGTFSSAVTITYDSVIHGNAVLTVGGTASVTDLRGLNGNNTISGDVTMNVAGGTVEKLIGVVSGTSTAHSLNLNLSGSTITKQLTAISTDGTVFTGDVNLTVNGNSRIDTGTDVNGILLAGGTINGDVTMNVTSGSFTTAFYGVNHADAVINGDLVFNFAGESKEAYSILAKDIIGVNEGTVTGTTTLNLFNKVGYNGTISGFQTINVTSGAVTAAYRIIVDGTLNIGENCIVSTSNLEGAGDVVIDATKHQGLLFRNISNFTGTFYLTFDGGATRTAITVNGDAVIHNGQAYTLKTASYGLDLSSEVYTSTTAVSGTIGGKGTVVTGGLTKTDKITQSGNTLYAGVLNGTDKASGLYFAAGDTEKTGSVQLDVDLTGGTRLTTTVYGGGTTGTTVAGDVTVNFKAGTTTYLFGGGYTGSTISGDVSVNLEAGTITSVYAAGGASDTISGNLSTTVGSTAMVGDLYAGSRVPKGSDGTTSAAAGKTISLDVQGGQITDMAIGGSYVIANSSNAVTHTDGNSKVTISGGTLSGKIVTGAAYANNAGGTHTMTVNSGTVGFTMTGGTVTAAKGIALGGVASNATHTTEDVTATFGGTSTAVSTVQGGWAQKGGTASADAVSINISGGSYGLVFPGIATVQGGTGATAASGTISSASVTVKGGTVDRLRANSTTARSTVLGDSVVKVTGGTVNNFCGVQDNTVNGNLTFDYSSDALLGKAVLVNLAGTVGGDVTANLTGGTVHGFEAINGGTVGGAVTVNFNGSELTGDTKMVAEGLATAGTVTANANTATAFEDLYGNAGTSSVNTILNVNADVTADSISKFDTINIALGSKITGDVTIAAGDTLNIDAGTVTAGTTSCIQAVAGSVSNAGTIAVTGEAAGDYFTYRNATALYALTGFYYNAGWTDYEAGDEVTVTDADGNTKTAIYGVNAFSALKGNEMWANGGTIFLGGTTAIPEANVIFQGYNPGADKQDIYAIVGSETQAPASVTRLDFVKDDPTARNVTCDIRNGYVTKLRMASWQGQTNNVNAHVLMSGGTVNEFYSASVQGGTHTGTTDVLITGGSINVLHAALGQGNGGKSVNPNENNSVHTGWTTLTMTGGTVNDFCGVRGFYYDNTNFGVVGIAGGTAAGGTEGADIVGLTVTGGTVNSLRATRYGTVYGNVTLTVGGSTYVKDLKGCEESVLHGNFNLNVTGGTYYLKEDINFSTMKCQVYGDSNTTFTGGEMYFFKAMNTASGCQLEDNFVKNLNVTLSDATIFRFTGMSSASWVKEDVSITINDGTHVGDYLRVMDASLGQVDGSVTVTKNGGWVNQLTGAEHSGSTIKGDLTILNKGGNTSYLRVVTAGTVEGAATVTLTGGSIGHLYGTNNASGKLNKGLTVNVNSGNGIRGLWGTFGGGTITGDVNFNINCGTSNATNDQTWYEGIYGVDTGTINGNFTVTLSGTAIIRCDVKAILSGTITGDKTICYKNYSIAVANTEKFISGFDHVNFTGSSTSTVTQFKAETAETWEFELAGFASGSTVGTLGSGNTLDFADDTLEVYLTDAMSAESTSWTLLSGSDLTNTASAKYKFYYNGTALAVDTNGYISDGENKFNGYGITAAATGFTFSKLA